MKFTILFATAACLFAIAAAVEFTIYSDRACATKSTDYSPNPIVATLNQCTAFPGGSFIKFTSCGAQAVANVYTDSTCKTVVGTPIAQKVDVSRVEQVGGSSKVSCGSAGPALQASTTVTASLVAAFAVYLIFN